MHAIHAARHKAHELIGSLRDNSTAIAERIVRASRGATITVWVDDESRIYGTSPESLPMVPVHWIIGTYGCGAPVNDIAEDLHAERSERARAWRLD